MKKLFVLFVSVITFVNLTLGKPIDQATAKLAGQTFVSAILNAGKNSSLDIVYTSASNATSSVSDITPTNCFYVFNINQNQGFVIISADDRVIPVLAYSNEKEFDPNNIPENTAKWLDGYSSQIMYILNNNLSATSNITQSWTDLIQGNAAPLAGNRGSGVSPLVQTLWDQFPNYNALCPYDNTSNQYAVTGCVATAMGQVMRYWKWPYTGSGFYSYNSSNYGTLSANFGNTTYQWSNMPLQVFGSSPQTQITAVATLLYQCGVSVNMNYNTAANGGSGAYLISGASPYKNCAQYALKTYFGYKKTLQGLKRSNYSDAQWTSMISAELDSSRPVLYVGYGSDGGHCFVCDGYNSSNYFHFNWGWSGQDNGYYTIDALNPGSFTFNDQQQALIGIQPDSSLQSFNLQLYNAVSLSSSTIPYGDSFSVYTNIKNNGTNTFKGDYCAAIFDTNKVFISYVDSIMSTTLTGGSNYKSALKFSTTGKYTMLPGIYNIYIYYRPTGGNWKLVSNGNYNNFAQIKVTYSNTIELYSAVSVTPGLKLTQGDTASVNLNVINTGSTTFYGQYQINLYDLNMNLVQTLGTYTENSGLLPNHSYNSPYLTFTTNSITANPGTYLLALYFYSNTGHQWQLAGSTYYTNPIKVIVQLPVLKPDKYERNNTIKQAYNLPVNFINNIDSINTKGSNIDTSTDIDYYKIMLAPGYRYSISARLQDAMGNNDGQTYTLDAMFSYSTDGQSWSFTFDPILSYKIPIIGEDSVYFLVQPYYTGETGTYRLDITITRSLLAPCSYSITPDHDTTTASGSSNSFSVTTTSTCAWSAVSNASWLTITSGSPGLGNGSVYYTVAANSGSSRTGTLFVKDAFGNSIDTFTVIQAAPNSIQESVDLGYLKIYPNPTSEKLNVDFNLTSSHKTIDFEIFSTLGQLMLFDNITGVQSGNINKVFDVQSLTNGVYILQIQIDNNTVINRKIVIQK